MAASIVNDNISLQTPAHSPSSGNSAFLAQLQEDPAAVMCRIRQLCADREKGSTTSELYEQLNSLQVSLEDRDKLSDRTWVTLVKGEKILDVYVKLVQSDGFFTDSVLMAYVFSGLANAVGQCKDLSEADIFLSRCTTLFRIVWQNRELLRRPLSEEVRNIVPEELGFGKEAHPAIVCLFNFVNLHREARDESPGVDTYIPHVALFSWVCLGDCHASVSGLLFLSEITRPNISSDMDRLVRDVILDVAGVEAAYACFERTIEQEFPLGDGFVALGAIAGLVGHPRMRPLLHKRELFKRLVERLDRRTCGGEQDDSTRENVWREWLMIYVVFSCVSAKIVTQDLKTAFDKKNMSRSGITYRGEDAIAFLACGSGLLAQAASRRRVEKYLGFESKCEAIMKAVTVLSGCATIDEWIATAPAFTDGVSRAARAVWIPTLEALRSGSYHLDNMSREYELLGEAWARTGLLLGLDEAQARREVHKFCSYWRCPSGYGGVERPGVLSICKACRMARYCGRQCQRGDWKTHKEFCENRQKNRLK